MAGNGEDILYLAREGWEEEFAEIYPGVSRELDGNGEPTGVEIMDASRAFSQVIEPLAESLEKSASYGE